MPPTYPQLDFRLYLTILNYVGIRYICQDRGSYSIFTEGEKMEQETRTSSERINWPSVIAGVLPFLIFGPAPILLAYPYPYPEWRMSPTFLRLQTAAALLPMAVGFGIGWLKRFPPWSYPYLVLTSGFLMLGVATVLNGEIGSQDDKPFIAGLLIFSVLIIGLFFFTRSEQPLRNLVKNIQADWTRLSLGLLIIPTVMFGGVEHEEEPILTFFVLGPVLVLCFTALLALVEKTSKTRARILAGGMLLMILVRLGSGDFFYLIYWFLAFVVVFMPYLIKRRF